MRVLVYIDGSGRQIDTRDPETLTRWLFEVFASFEPSPQTDIRVQVTPSWTGGTFDKPPAPDWIADSQIITRQTPVVSPREFVTMLQDQITDYEAKQAGLSA